MVRLILDLLRKFCNLSLRARNAGVASENCMNAFLFGSWSFRSESKQQKITLVIGDVIIVNHKG